MGQGSSSLGRNDQTVVNDAILPFLSLPTSAINSLWLSFSLLGSSWSLDLDNLQTIFSFARMGTCEGIKTEGQDWVSLLDQAYDYSGVSSEEGKSKEEVALTNLFNLFDTDENGLIDALELFSVLAFTSVLSLEDKVRFIINIFTLQKSEYFSFNEISLLYCSTYMGLSKIIYGGITDEHSILSQATRNAQLFANNMIEIFSSNNNYNVKVEDFVSYALSDPKILGWFNSANTLKSSSSLQTVSSDISVSIQLLELFKQQELNFVTNIINSSKISSTSFISLTSRISTNDLIKKCIEVKSQYEYQQKLKEEQELERKRRQEQAEEAGEEFVDESVNQAPVSIISDAHSANNPWINTSKLLIPSDPLPSPLDPCPPLPRQDVNPVWVGSVNTQITGITSPISWSFPDEKQPEVQGEDDEIELPVNEIWSNELKLKLASRVKRAVRYNDSSCRGIIYHAGNNLLTLKKPPVSEDEEPESEEAESEEGAEEGAEVESPPLILNQEIYREHAHPISSLEINEEANIMVTADCPVPTKESVNKDSQVNIKKDPSIVVVWDLKSMKVLYRHIFDSSLGGFLSLDINKEANKIILLHNDNYGTVSIIDLVSGAKLFCTTVLTPNSIESSKSHKLPPLPYGVNANEFPAEKATDIKFFDNDISFAVSLSIQGLRVFTAEPSHNSQYHNIVNKNIDTFSFSTFVNSNIQNPINYLEYEVLFTSKSESAKGLGITELARSVLPDELLAGTTRGEVLLIQGRVITQSLQLPFTYPDAPISALHVLPSHNIALVANLRGELATISLGETKSEKTVQKVSQGPIPLPNRSIEVKDKFSIRHLPRLNVDNSKNTTKPFSLIGSAITSVNLDNTSQKALITTLTNEIFEVRLKLPPPRPKSEDEEAEEEVPPEVPVAEEGEDGAPVEVEGEPEVVKPPKKPQPRFGDLQPKGIRLSFPSSGLKPSNVLKFNCYSGATSIVKIPGSFSFVTSGIDGVIRLWTKQSEDVEGESPAPFIQSQYVYVESPILSMASTASLLVACLESGKIIILNLPDFTFSASITLEETGLNFTVVQIAPEGNLIACGCDDCYIYFFKPSVKEVPESEPITIWNLVAKVSSQGLPPPPPPAPENEEVPSEGTEEVPPAPVTEGEDGAEQPIIIEAPKVLVSDPPTSKNQIPLRMDFTTDGAYLRVYFYDNDLKYFDMNINFGLEIIKNLPPKPLPPAPRVVNEDDEDAEPQEVEEPVWAGLEIIEMLKGLTWNSFTCPYTWESAGVEPISSEGQSSSTFHQISISKDCNLSLTHLFNTRYHDLFQNVLVSTVGNGNIVFTRLPCYMPPQPSSDYPTATKLPFERVESIHSGAISGLTYLEAGEPHVASYGSDDGSILVFKINNFGGEEIPEDEAEAKDIPTWLSIPRNAGQWMKPSSEEEPEEDEDGNPKPKIPVTYDSGDEDDWEDDYLLHSNIAQSKLPTDLEVDSWAKSLGCNNSGQLLEKLGFNSPINSSHLPDVHLELEWVYGSSLRHTRNTVKYIESGEIIYPAGCNTVFWDRKNEVQNYLVPHNGEITASDIHLPSNLGASSHKSVEYVFIYIFGLNSKTVTKVINVGKVNGVSALSFSPDGKYIAAALQNAGHTLSIFDVKNGNLIASSEGAGGETTGKTLALAWSRMPQSPHKHRIVQGGLGHLQFWTLDTRFKKLSVRVGVFGSTIGEVDEEKGKPIKPNVISIMNLPLTVGELEEGQSPFEAASGNEFVIGLSNGNVGLVERNEIRFGNAVPLFKGPVNSLALVSPTPSSLGKIGLGPIPGQPLNEVGDDPLAYRIVAGGANGDIKLLSSDLEDLYTWNLYLDSTLKLYSLGRVIGVKSLDVDKWNRKLLFGMSGGEIGEINLSTGKIILPPRFAELPPVIPDESKKDEIVELSGAIQITGHCRGDLTGLCAHPLRNECLTAGDDKSLRLWDIENHSLLTSIDLPGRAISCMFAPNGHLIAVSLKRDGSAKHKLSLAESTLEKAKANLAAVEQSEADARAEAEAEKAQEEGEGEGEGEEDQPTVDNEDLKEPEISPELQAAKDAVDAATFEVTNAINMCRGRIAIISYLQGKLSLVDILGQALEEITSFVFSPQGTILYASSIDGKIYVYDTLNNFKLLQTLGSGIGEHGSGDATLGHTQPIESLDINVEGTLLVSQGSNYEVKVWSLSEAGIVENESSAPLDPSSALSALNNQNITWLTRQNTLGLDSLGVYKSSGNLQTITSIARTFNAPSLGLKTDKHSSDRAKVLIAGTNNGTLNIYTLPSQQFDSPFKSYNFHGSGSVAKVVVSHHNDYVFSIGKSDRIIAQWKIVKGIELNKKSFPVPVQDSLPFGDIYQNSFVVEGVPLTFNDVFPSNLNKNSYVQLTGIINASNGSNTLYPQFAEPNKVILSSGRFIGATDYSGNNFKLALGLNSLLSQNVRKHETVLPPVSAYTVSPCGKYVCVGFEEQTVTYGLTQKKIPASVYIFDAISGEFLLKLHDQINGSVTKIYFSPNGQYIACLSYSNFTSLYLFYSASAKWNNSLTSYEGYFATNKIVDFTFLKPSNTIPYFDSQYNFYNAYNYAEGSILFVSIEENNLPVAWKLKSYGLLPTNFVTQDNFEYDRSVEQFFTGVASTVMGVILSDVKGNAHVWDLVSGEISNSLAHQFSSPILYTNSFVFEFNIIDNVSVERTCCRNLDFFATSSFIYLRSQISLFNLDLSVESLYSIVPNFFFKDFGKVIGASINPSFTQLLVTFSTGLSFNIYIRTGQVSLFSASPSTSFDFVTSHPEKDFIATVSGNTYSIWDISIKNVVPSLGGIINDNSSAPLTSLIAHNFINDDTKLTSAKFISNSVLLLGGINSLYVSLFSEEKNNFSTTIVSQLDGLSGDILHIQYHNGKNLISLSSSSGFIHLVSIDLSDFSLKLLTSFKISDYDEPCVASDFNVEGTVIRCFGTNNAKNNFKSIITFYSIDSNSKAPIQAYEWATSSSPLASEIRGINFTQLDSDTACYPSGLWQVNSVTSNNKVVAAAYDDGLVRIFKAPISSGYGCTPDMYLTLPTTSSSSSSLLSFLPSGRLACFNKADGSVQTWSLNI